jgi:hypothetical protein
MSHSYFVEFLNHSGDLQTRHSFSSLPIRIGRAYNNDIILDDPHTAAHHAIIDITENGDLLIRDLGSSNGIYCKSHQSGQRHSTKNSGTGVQQQEFRIHGDDVYHLGHTQIRVRTLDYAVAPEIIDATNYRWQGWPVAIAALGIISLLAFCSTWLNDIDESKSTTYIISIFAWLGYAITWAAIWALANRVFGGVAHFSRHLFIVSCGVTAVYLWGHLASLLAYSFSLEGFTRYGSHLEIALFAATVYYHLRQITPRRAKRLKIVCASLALVSSGLLLMKNHQGTSQYADELYMPDIFPPAVRLSRNHSLEEFETDILQLKTKVDSERESALQNNKSAK